MGATKMSISFNADLSDEVRAAAKRAGLGLSAWLAEAAEAKLRAEAFDEWFDEWEREHGPLTDAEIARAVKDLGLRPQRRAG